MGFGVLGLPPEVLGRMVGDWVQRRETQTQNLEAQTRNLEAQTQNLEAQPQNLGPRGTVTTHGDIKKMSPRLPQKALLGLGSKVLGPGSKVLGLGS